MPHIARLHGVFALALVFLGLLGTGGVAAERAAAPNERVQIGELRQRDLDGDGRPDLTTIDCAIATPRDRVLVYDDSGQMRQANSWAEATNFTSDTWIFDIGSRGGESRASLVIAFRREGAETVARIYDGGGTVDGVRYEVRGKSVRVVEPQYPALTVRATGDWLTPDGMVKLPPALAV